ncbi:MAG: hypothetical protein ACREBP_05995 [Sphingomicrobium sp.]
MSTVNIIIIIVAVISVVAILGVRAGRQRGTKEERRPSTDDRKDVD